jgi:uncharacterized protein
MVRKKHLKYLSEFKRSLSSQIPIKKMYLFGSRAKGKPGRWSDFDLLIVSKAFRKREPFRRAEGLYEKWGIDYPVDFLCYTPEEFAVLKRQVTIVKEAVDRGIEI